MKLSVIDRFPKRGAPMQNDFTITLDHVDEYIREEARKAVNKYFDFLQKTVSSYPLGDTELGGKAKDCAEKSITMTRDYMHKLTQAKSFLEAVPIHTEFVQSQLGFMGDKLKALARFIPKQRQRYSTLLFREFSRPSPAFCPLSPGRA
jgi:hypothetical protein